MRLAHGNLSRWRNPIVPHAPFIGKGQINLEKMPPTPFETVRHVLRRHVMTAEFHAQFHPFDRLLSIDHCQKSSSVIRLLLRPASRKFSRK